MYSKFVTKLLWKYKRELLAQTAAASHAFGRGYSEWRVE